MKVSFTLILSIAAFVVCSQENIDLNGEWHMYAAYDASDSTPIEMCETEKPAISIMGDKYIYVANCNTCIGDFGFIEGDEIKFKPAKCHQVGCENKPQHVKWEYKYLDYTQID